MSDKLLDIGIRHTLNTANGVLPMEISMSVPLGGILAVTGPSGSGKTTFLRQLAGLSVPKYGHIRHNNITWFDEIARINLPVQKRNIGFVFQDYALFPHLTVEQNLLFALERDSNQDVVYELLKAIDLEQLANRKPHQLSGGQQQRVALARALVRKPDLLLLDEPLSALDSSMRGNLQELLLQFHQEYGFTMIIVTHDLSEIFRLADQLVVLEQGKIVSHGTPAEVYTPKQVSNSPVALYGEVVSVTHKENYWLVSALINHKIHFFELPISESREIKRGDSFTIPYQLDTTKIQLFDKS